MSEQKCETTHYFDGTKWLKATEKSCENCNNYKPMYVCTIPEANMKECLSSKYRDFWVPKEEPKTDRSCEICVNYLSPARSTPDGFTFCALSPNQRESCLSSLIRQFWHKKEETKNKDSEEMQKHDNDFNETLGFEAKQSKKIKGIEIKPTKTTIHETYELSLKDMEILFRKTFDLDSKNKMQVRLRRDKMEKIIEVEIERNW